MNSRIFRLSRILGLAAAFPIAWGGPAESPDDSNPLILVKTVQPVYPAALEQRGIAEGEVSVVFSVNAEGVLEDIMPLAYSHMGFYDAAVLAMKQWEFQPARKNGRAHPVVQFVTINFKSSGSVISMTPGDAAVAASQFGGMRSDGYRVASLSELDAIPTPVHIVRPGYPEVYYGSGIEGKVTVEFYIDEDGRVRMPAIIESNGLDFGGAAIEAVSQWTFQPPTRDGRPVAAVVKQQFVFAPSEAES